MAGLATKKVEAGSGLVPRLAGGWLRPELVKYSKFNMTAKIQDQHHTDDFIFF